MEIEEAALKKEEDRLSQDRLAALQKELAELKPGDLIFFQGRRMTKNVGHVGLVKEVNAEKGDVSFIHAACSGVRVDKLSMDYYKKRFIGFRRVL